MGSSLKLFIMFLFIACVGGTGLAVQKAFSQGYQYVDELKAFLKLHTEPSTWENASNKCEEEGGILASPDDEKMMSSMKLLMIDMQNSDSHAIYTGISVLKNYFIRGKAIANLPGVWMPSKLNKESCIVMDFEGQMTEVSCSDSYPHVCYKQLCECGIADDPGYRYENRTGSFYKLHTESRTWINATLICAAEHAHLAIINSATEAQVLKEIRDTHPEISYAFIGLARWAEGSIWHTLQGQTAAEAGYDSWILDLDRNGRFTTHNCGGIQRGEDVRMYSLGCYSTYPFICEYDAN